MTLSEQLALPPARADQIDFDSRLDPKPFDVAAPVFEKVLGISNNFIRTLAGQCKIPSLSAVPETLFAEWTSRLGALRYLER